ncbi:hypothetical protein ACK1FJ_004643 [Salmonella enterica]
MIRLLLCFFIFICNSSYSYDVSEYLKTYNSEKYYYLSSKIPEEVHQLSFYTDYCTVYLSYSLTRTPNINSISDNIHKYCANLEEWNIKLKEKYTNNKEALLILTMTDDAILIYHDYKK